MYPRNVKRLPVVDSGGRLAGIVSRPDVPAVYTRTDAGIAQDIRTRHTPSSAGPRFPVD
jgi:CBS domain-containing protein